VEEQSVKVAVALQGVASLFLDTAPVIYYVERNPTYAALLDDIFDRVDSGAIRAVTSPITLGECLIVPIRQGLLQAQRDFTDLIVSGAWCHAHGFCVGMRATLGPVAICPARGCYLLPLEIRTHFLRTGWPWSTAADYTEAGARPFQRKYGVAACSG